MTFLILTMTLNDHDIHDIRIRIEFWIESYAYHVNLAIFQIFDPKMTFFDPVRWPRMTSRCTSLNSEENFQSNGMHIMCIWPYFRFSTPNDLFDPVRWPRMTSRCTPLNSEEHFQPNSMHIMCISQMAEKKRSDHCFDHKWSISGNSDHFIGGILYISRISSLRRFEWYPFEPLAEKKCICLSVPLFLVDLRSLTFNTKLNNR